MNHREVFERRNGHLNTRDTNGGNRERGKEREREVADSISKLGPVASVPRINRVKRFQLRNTRALDNADQIEPCIGDGSRTVGKSKQRQHRPLRPHFGVIGTRPFQLRKRQNYIADGTRADQKPAQGYFRPYSLRAFSRRTMRASSTARSRLIWLSRTMPVSAMPSASLPVTLAMYPASSHPLSGGPNG